MPAAQAFRTVQRRFRDARMAAFLAEFQVGEHTRILDVGGSADTWTTKAQVVLLNMPRASGEVFAPEFQCVYGDACRLPFRDRAFDIVFSNSVIEHVGSAEAQAQFAAEVARVGKSFWIQTPNRHFPIEAHLWTPFIHWLPPRFRAWVARRFTVWALIQQPSEDRKRWYIEHFLNDIRLCTAAELRRLFPGATIHRERFLLLAKSLIAVRK